LQETVARLLHAHAQRLTPRRQRIVDILAGAGGPLTILDLVGVCSRGAG
jgi:Fe2+ or Zn2+ uptake regulation protein